MRMRRFLLFVFAAQTLLLTVNGQESKCVKAGGHANLPWGKHGATAGIGAESKRREEAYKALPDECCEQNTAFFHSSGKEMDTTCDNKRFKHKTVASKNECEEQCYIHYQKWAMFVGVDNDPDDPQNCWAPRFGKCPLFKCVTAVYYTTRPGCSGQGNGCGQPSCMLFTGYPNEIGVGFDGNLCNLKAADTAETLMLKPDCSLIPGIGYYKPLSTEAPRMTCNRASLPWSTVDEHDQTSLEPSNEVGSTRIRIYEKLRSYCCSSDGSFNNYPKIKYSDGPCGQTITAPFIRSEQWKQASSDDMDILARQKCQKFCHDIYLLWVMGHSDKPCLSAIFRRSIAPYINRICDLYSDATYSNKKCLHKALEQTDKDTSILEIKQQCIANETGYTSKVCDSSTVDGCYVRVRAFGTAFLACKNLAHSMVVDTVYWTMDGERRDHMLERFCKLAEKKDYFNSRIRDEGFPTEVEFNMIPVGVHLCGYRWMADNINPVTEYKITRTVEALLQLNFHCAPIGDIDLSPALTTPKTFPYSDMPSGCQVYSTAFEDKLEHTDLVGSDCNAYATEKVSAEWRCRAQCLGYYINNYNYQKFTYDGKSCRAVVVYKDTTDEFFKCELYDWDPHEIPSQIAEFKESRCQVRSAAQGRHLYLFKHSCYAVTTPAPGDWDVSTLLPYMIEPTCDAPNEAFEHGRSQETACEYAEFWKEGENPSRPRKQRELTKSYFKDFWDTGAQNEKLVELYGLDNYEINKYEVLKHHCKMTCLNIQKEYFIGLREKPCRAVALVTLAPQLYRGRNQFCIYKTWPREHRMPCMSYRVANMPDMAILEYTLHLHCYEPKGTYPESIPDEPEESEPKGKTVRPTAPVGYPDNYDHCFGSGSRLHLLFNNDGQKELSCKTTGRVITSHARENAHFACTHPCLIKAKEYWYHRYEHRADPDCKAVSVVITDTGGSRVGVACFYYSWAAGKRQATCQEVDNPDNATLWVLDSSCHEPEGITLKTCPTFGGVQIDGGLEATYTLESADKKSVAHLGTVLFKCGTEEIAQFTCNDGHWYRRCGGRHCNYDWHYIKELNKFFKKFNDDMTFDEAVQKCQSNCKAQLPSVHSVAENNHVSAAAASHKIWLGLTMDASKDEWIWNDGSTLDFKSDLGHCPQLECPCFSKPAEICHHSGDDRTCVQSVNGEWSWGARINTCDLKAKVVCQIILVEKDDARLLTEWDDICRQAERENDYKTLKTCKEVRKCERYFEKCGKHKQTEKGKKCRALINNTPTTASPAPAKWSLGWCKHKLELHGKKNKLKCIKKCNKLFPGITKGSDEKYSVEWCQEKMKAHRSKPRLQCIKKCKKILDEAGQATKKPSQEEKYCQEKIKKLGDRYPQLSCVRKCKKKFG